MMSAERAAAEHDAIATPKHYRSHPSGLECVEITSLTPTCVGSAIKYVWRWTDKDRPAQDLGKARQFLEFHQTYVGGYVPPARVRELLAIANDADHDTLRAAVLADIARGDLDAARARITDVLERPGALDAALAVATRGASR